MIKIVLIAALVGMAAAAPQEALAQIIRSDAENDGLGSFRYNYETTNGISAVSSGYIKNPNARAEDQIQVIEGSYSYYGPDGVLYTVNYIADENGYRATGAHLPQAGAPLPVAQQRRPFQG